MSKYTVVVGNVGKVYDGKSKKDALAAFDDYKNLSKSKSGRASGEEVSLLEDGEVVKSYDAVKKSVKPKEPAKPTVKRNGSSTDKTAYCMKCKSSVIIRLPKSETLSNGVHAVRGSCPDCGTKVFRLLGK